MSSILQGSETAFDFHCDLCYKDNFYLEAVGYCSDCKDYLCQECYKHHLKPKPVRHHVLLDQHRMPKDTSQSKDKDLCTEPCAEHKSKTLEYYCADHGSFGCCACMTLKHRNCGGVNYIPDIAGDVLTSTEYKDMNLKVKNMTKTAQEAISIIQQNNKTPSQQHSSASDFFKQLRKYLIGAVDKLETLIMNDAGKIRDEDQDRMKSAEDQFNNLLKDIGALDSKFTILKNKGQNCQIFFSMKRSQDEIAALETSIRQLEEQGIITEYVIKLSEGLQDLIKQPENMASLEIINTPQALLAQEPAGVVSSKHQRPQQEEHVQIKHLSNPTTPLSKSPMPLSKSPVPLSKPTAPLSKPTEPLSKPTEPLSKPTTPLSKPTAVGLDKGAVGLDKGAAEKKTREHRKPAAEHVANVGVRMEEDRYDPRITGSVVLPGDKLVVVDCSNSKIKFIDLKSNMIASHMKFDTDLRDIAAVTDAQVAVTSPCGNQVLLINVSNKLTLDHIVNVNGECWSVACFDDKLVITYDNPVKVEMMSRKGKLLRTVVTEDKGRQLFTRPRYVAASPDHQTLYISGSNRVTSLDLTNGSVKSTYKDNELGCPNGMTVDRAGKLYVCGWISYNVHQLTADLNKIKILLQKSDGLVNPESVSYDKGQNKLYIGMFKSDIVKVYQLH